MATFRTKDGQFDPSPSLAEMSIGGEEPDMRESVKKCPIQACPATGGSPITAVTNLVDQGQGIILEIPG